MKELKLLPYPQDNGNEYRQDVIKRLMVLEIIKSYIGKEVYITLCSLLDYDKDNELALCKEVLL